MQLCRLVADPEQEYYLFEPARVELGAPIVVCVHGSSRNAAEHARCFAPLAAAHRAVLVAPLFAADRFPDYQRLGRNGRGMRADLMLERIVDEVRGIVAGAPARWFLIGHSGGAQFVHRYAMAHPEKVERYVGSAAGWYTMPDPAVSFPLGIGRAFDLADLVFDARAFLSVPGCVLVGSRDTGRGPAFKKSKRIDRDQGTTRLDRGRIWSAAMNRAAAALGLPARVSFRELPGAAHRFSGMARRGGLPQAAFAFLFGKIDGLGSPDQIEPPEEDCGDKKELTGRCIVAEFG